MKKGSVRKEIVFDKLETYINELKVTPQMIFEETSETTYRVDSIMKKTEMLIEEVQNLNMNQITKEEKNKLEENLENLTSLIKIKFK